MFLEGAITEDGVVDCHASKIVVNRIFRVDKGVRNVRDVVAAVALTSQVNFAVLNLEGIDKAFIKTNEFLGKLDFVGDIRNAL